MPDGYLYKKLKEGGASALDAAAVVKVADIIRPCGYGLHVQEEPASQTLKAAVGRHRAAAHLRAQ